VEKLEDGAVVLGSDGEAVSGGGAYRRDVERGWRRGWGRRRAVGGDAAAHNLRGGWRRAVSGGWLGGGYSDAVAYPSNDEDDGGVAHSDKRGQKQSGGFGHELSGRRPRRGERPAVGRAAAVRTGHSVSGQRL
jgi:hypothetical protein